MNSSATQHIYRIATAQDWQRAKEDGFFASADLQAEGFIHCSFASQVRRTLGKHYPTMTSLMLLQIDTVALGAALVCEDLHGSGVFPHVYAEIAIHSIRSAVPIHRDSADNWILPTGV